MAAAQKLRHFPVMGDIVFHRGHGPGMAHDHDGYPRQEQRFVVPLMMGAALRGEPIPVHDGGRQTRCFTYVADAVDAMVRAGDKPGVAPLLHVGTTEEVTMADLAERIGRAVGGNYRTTVDHPSDRLGEAYQDIPRRVPDASLARTVLGWEPRVSLDDGLARTVEWVRGSAATSGPVG